jgi:hypothetical protein
MTTENKVIDLSYEAGEDLSDYQYHIVVLDTSTKKVRLPNAETDIPLAVLQNAPESGEAASVRPIGCGGVSKVVANAALAVGALAGLEYVAADDAGKAKALAATQHPVGIIVESAGAENDLAGILLVPLRTLNWFAGNAASAADSLVIPITARHVSKTTGADAEALTLANGTPGQRLTITLVVDGGGAGTLTPATCTGFATIVFADAGDSACLEYVDDTVGWVLVGTAGVAAPPAISV